MMQRDECKAMIPMAECKDGWLYIVRCRNASIGIYDEKQQGFVISRFKFGSNFLFTEYHYEASEDFGTACPIEEVELAPNFNSDFEKLEYINSKREELNSRVDAAIDRWWPEWKAFVQRVADRRRENPEMFKEELEKFDKQRYV